MRGEIRHELFHDAPADALVLMIRVNGNVLQVTTPLRKRSSFSVHPARSCGTVPEGCVPARKIFTAAL
jgi:hypothetical protein